MYSLDINFLNDRPDYVTQKTKRKGGKIQVGDRTALIAGVATGVFFPALVMGFWFVAQSGNQKLQDQLATLEGQAGQLASKDSEYRAIRAQSAQIKAETDGLALLFNTSLKPVSAILQDIRDRVPANVQIADVEQTVKVATPVPGTPPPAAAPPPPAAGTPPAAGAPPAAAAPPPPAVSPWQQFTQKLVINGTAKSFDEVNDFMLGLQDSKFLNASEVKILEANLTDNPLQTRTVLPQNKNKQPDDPSNEGQPPEIQLPKVVTYKIEAGVSNANASEVVRELNRKGAIGLATRIEQLQNKEVIKP